MSYECFRLDMGIVTDTEKLRALLTQILTTQAELQDKVAELHARFESMETDLRFVLDKSGVK